MLIPVGLDDSKLSRIPVVSFGIIGLCTLVFLGTMLGHDDAGEKLDAAIYYHMGHPYFAAPKELLALFPRQHGLEHAASTDDAERADEQSERPPWLQDAPRDQEESDIDPEERADEQKELNRLGAEAAQAINNRSDRRWGFIPARPSLVTLVTCLFLHASLAHLIGNMIFFFYTGPFLEDRWGSRNRSEEHTSELQS